MPVGVYRKKNKKGRFMYFRDGKLISKKSYDASKRSTKSRSTRKGMMRKTSRRAYTKRSSRPKMRKSIPHPSVTGMASGLAIASYLNSGKTISKTTEGVVKDVADGELGKAFNTLSTNAVGMIGSDVGRKTLVTAGTIAVLGTLARRHFPQLKLGGSKLYFRL